MSTPWISTWAALLLWLPAVAAAEIRCELTERGEAGQAGDAFTVVVADSLAQAPSTEVIRPATLFPELRADVFAYRDPQGRVVLSASWVNLRTYQVTGATSLTGSVTASLFELDRAVLVSCATF